MDESSIPSHEVGYDARYSIFHPNPIDISTESELTVDYRPLATVKRGQTIEFLVPNTNTYYTDFSRTFLSLKVRLRRSDDSAIDKAKDKVGLVQLPLSGL